MQPMPGQPVAQQPIQVQAAPAQGYMPINVNTGKEEKEWGIWTPTPAEWGTAILVLLGLVFWAIMGSMADDPDVDIFTIYLMNGLAYSFWAGAIVSAIHSVEKALLNSKK